MEDYCGENTDGFCEWIAPHISISKPQFMNLWYKERMPLDNANSDRKQIRTSKQPTFE